MQNNCLTEEKWDLENNDETQDDTKDFNDTRKESSTPNKSKKCVRRSSDKFNEIKQKLRKVSVEDMQKLCEQIASLNDRIMNAREITYLRYELPVEMKNKLEMEAQELESLYAEMRDATRNLEIVRAQRAALGTERKWMVSQIMKLKADDMAEMEVIVSVYDSTMMAKWEDVKQSTSVSEVENFLHDVKGKMEAMKNLQILGTNKLAELRNPDGKKEEKSKKEKKRLNREKRDVEMSCSTSDMDVQSQTTLATFDAQSDDFTEDFRSLDSIVYNIMYDPAFNLDQAFLSF